MSMSKWAVTGVSSKLDGLLRFVDAEDEREAYESVRLHEEQSAGTSMALVYGEDDSQGVALCESEDAADALESLVDGEAPRWGWLLAAAPVDEDGQAQGAVQW